MMDLMDSGLTETDMYYIFLSIERITDSVLYGMLCRCFTVFKRDGKTVLRYDNITFTSKEINHIATAICDLAIGTIDTEEKERMNNTALNLLILEQRMIRGIWQKA